VPAKFADDEQACHRQCPAAEAALFSYRNPGEDVSRAISMSGKLYSELPTAFSYRKQINPSCSCRAPGQSWADALRQADDFVERGDIVVTEERARQLSQPRVDAQGKPIVPQPNQVRPAGPGGPGAKSAHAVPADSAVSTAGLTSEAKPEQKADEDPAKRKVRSVGPAFLPARSPANQ
jgi:hypothetical protein